MTAQEGGGNARPRPRALEDVAEAARLLGAVPGAARDPCYLIDAGKRFRFASAEALAALGHAGPEPLDRTWREAGLAATVMEEVERHWDRVLATGEGAVAETELPVAGGRRILEHRLDPVRGAAGKIAGVLATVRDVTERLRAEAALRERDERLRLALAAGGMGTWRWDAASGRVDWDEQQRALHGVPPGRSPVNAEVWTLVHPEDRAALRAAYKEALAKGDEFATEYRIVRPDGTVRWLASRCRALRDADGRVVGTTGVTFDVTARHEAEAALRESEARRSREQERERRRLELILENVSEAITAVFVDTGTTVRNRAWLTFHGYSSFAELEGWRLEEIAPLFEIYSEDGHLLPLAEVPLSRALRGESFQDLQVRLRRRDTGREWWGSYNGSALRDAEGRVVAALISMRDVTQQRRAEAALRESEERFRRAVTGAAVPVMLHAEDGEVLAVSEGLLAATGYGRAEIARFEDWLALAYRERAAEHAASVARRFRERLSMEGVEVAVHIRSGEVRAWVWNAPPPERLADGRLCFFAIASDVTERQRAEAELKALVEQRDRLLLELHHRVKNNLQLVRSLLQIQAARSGDPKVVELFEQAGQRIAAIAQVHASLHQDGASGRLELAAYLKGLCRRLGESFLETGQGRIGIQVEAEPAEVEVDRAIPLGLIVNELVTNAVKHGLAGGRVPGTVWVRLGAVGGGTWRLEVTDDGAPPAAEADQPRAGLGMQLVEGFARQLRGTVTVDSRPRFSVRVEFPL